MKGALFHLAFPIHDVAAAKRFYVEGLGCTLGRESSHAVTFGLAGHQLVAHLTAERLPTAARHLSPPFRPDFFVERFVATVFGTGPGETLLPFYQQPRVRFPGARIEHHTFFLEDPSGNLLEFKHYTHESAIFGERDYSEVGDSL